MIKMTIRKPDGTVDYECTTCGHKWTRNITSNKDDRICPMCKAQNYKAVLYGGAALYALYTEQSIVAENMERYGGSFAKHLGIALLYADIHNAAKIKKTWPELWEKYLNWGKKK